MKICWMLLKRCCKQRGENCALKENWLFPKGETIPTELPQDWEAISLPHTWNAVDGQDGGGDYYRGHGVYVRPIRKNELPKAE